MEGIRDGFVGDDCFVCGLLWPGARPCVRWVFAGAYRSAGNRGMAEWRLTSTFNSRPKPNSTVSSIMLLMQRICWPWWPHPRNSMAGTYKP